MSEETNLEPVENSAPADLANDVYDIAVQGHEKPSSAADDHSADAGDTSDDDAGGTEADEWADLEKPPADDADDDEDGEEGKPKSHMIPISRLQKEKAKRVALEARLAAYESGQPPPAQRGAPQAEARAVEPGHVTVEQIDAHIRANDPGLIALEAKAKDIEENPDRFPDQAAFARALAAANRDVTERLLDGRQVVRGQLAEQQRTQATTQAQAQAAYAQKLLGNYDKALTASTIPGIQEARKRFEALAPTHLPPHIREAILSSDEPDVYVAALTGNRKLFDEFTKAPPIPATFLRLARAADAYRGGEKTAPKPPPAPVVTPKIDQVRRRSENSTASHYDSEGTFVMTPERHQTIRKEFRR